MTTEELYQEMEALADAGLIIRCIRPDGSEGWTLTELGRAALRADETDEQETH